MNTQRYPLWLLILGVLLFFPALGARDFWAPVEPRYAEIARVMFSKGEWIVPTINGNVYTDKPILYFWLVLIFSKVTGGVSEWTVRLPAALGALGTILATYKIGKDHFSPRIGFIAGAVLATSARVMWEGRWAHVDMLFTFFFTLAMVFAAPVILRNDHRAQLLLSYVSIALATLTKGLIGVVLPALILLSFVVIRRDWRLLLRVRVPWGIVMFLLIAAPWFIAVNSVTDGTWLRDFIYIHHIQRYTAGLGHRQPSYYYFETLPLDFLPWTIFCVASLFTYGVKRKWFQQPTQLFFIVWFIVVLLFFTVSDTKRDLYLLPLFPPLALLVGTYIDDLVAGQFVQGALYRGLLLIFFTLTFIGCLALPVVGWFVQRDAVTVILPCASVIAVGSLLIVYFVWQRSPWRVFVSTVLTMLIGMLTGATWFLPFLDRYKSPRPLSIEVRKNVPPTAPLYVFADTMNDFNFYVRREVIRVLKSSVELEDLLAKDRSVYLLIKQKDLEEIPSTAAQKTLATRETPGHSWYLIVLGGRSHP